MYHIQMKVDSLDLTRAEIGRLLFVAAIYLYKEKAPHLLHPLK